eukprot:scaffold12072_cov116-Isochrysis_galbana.AAC.3
MQGHAINALWKNIDGSSNSLCNLGRCLVRHIPEYQCEHPIVQLAPNPSSVAWASGSVGPKPGSLGPIGQNEFPLG